MAQLLLFQGNTAIHYAVSNCNFEIVSLLLDTGICDLNKQNKAGYTAIIMATLASVVTQKHEEVVQRLFSMGDVNIKASKVGRISLTLNLNAPIATKVVCFSRRLKC